MSLVDERDEARRIRDLLARHKRVLRACDALLFATPARSVWERERYSAMAKLLQQASERALTLSTEAPQ